MKRVIDGKSYNTDTATLVVQSEGGHWQSQAWWSLYQTRHGAFFKVVVGHDGEEVQEFRPLADTEAQAFLEAHANHLVERFFGQMPEGGASERRITIRIPGNLADRLEAAASAKGLSFNSYAMRCFEKSVTLDGDPGGRS